MMPISSRQRAFFTSVGGSLLIAYFILIGNFWGVMDWLEQTSVRVSYRSVIRQSREKRRILASLLQAPRPTRTGSAPSSRGEKVQSPLPGSVQKLDRPASPAQPKSTQEPDPDGSDQAGDEWPSLGLPGRNPALIGANPGQWPGFKPNRPGQASDRPENQDENGLIGEKIIYTADTPYQRISIIESRDSGRALVLDDEEQISEREDLFYNEAFHVIFSSHPQPRRVLIIGCGDGGILREALKHPVQTLIQAEIDRQVIKVTRQYLPVMNTLNGKSVWDDPRVQLIYNDGRQVLRQQKEKFDIIIVDLPAPRNELVASLYTREFTELVKAKLNPNGYFMRNAPAHLLQPQPFAIIYKTVQAVFGPARTEVYAVNDYTTFIIAANSRAPLPAELTQSEIQKILRERSIQPRFYSPERHFQYLLALPPPAANVPICTDDNPSIIYAGIIRAMNSALEQFNIEQRKLKASQTLHPAER
jgi:spermidine synthase